VQAVFDESFLVGQGQAKGDFRKHGMIMGGHSVKDVVFTNNYSLTQSVTNTREALRELYHHLETFNPASEPQKLVDGLRFFNPAHPKSWKIWLFATTPTLSNLVNELSSDKTGEVTVYTEVSFLDPVCPSKRRVGIHNLQEAQITDTKY